MMGAKEFIWYYRCMISAKKYMHESEQCNTEYHWYKYLVQHQIKDWLNSIKFWKRFGKQDNNTLPF